MTEKKVTVIQAARSLLAVCDGAVTLDGQGFNKLDAYFVRDVIERIDQTGRRLSPKQERALHRTLKKYTGQLSRMGIEYKDIELIYKPFNWDEASVSDRVQLCREAGLDGKTGSKAFKDLEPETWEKLKAAQEKHPQTLREVIGKNQPMKLDFITEQYSNFYLYSRKDFREQAKAIPTAHWNPDRPEGKAWSYHNKPEVVEALLPYIEKGIIAPTLRASEAMAELTEIILKRRQVKILKQTEDFSSLPPIPVKTEPYKHQMLAYQVGVALDQAALLMEQGTGKTLSAIGTAGYRFQQGQIKKLLVVAPLSVISVWHEEFAKHATFPYRLVDLTKKDNDKRTIDLKLAPKPDRLFIALINYESTWRTDGLLLKWKPDMVIVDESQKIKSGRAKQSRGLHRLGDIAKYKMILTGTPITQGPLDTWSQYRFLNPDIFGRSYVKFRDRYAVMGGYGGYEVIGYKNLEELAEKAHSIAYRVTKDEAGISTPPVDQIIEVELRPETRKIYKAMEEDFMVAFGEEEYSSAPIVLTQLLRLQQITGGYLPLEGKEEASMKLLDSSKMDSLKELLLDLPSRKKVVIFARFRAELDGIEKIANEIGRKIVVMKGGVKNRGEIIKSFQEDPTVTIFAAQIQTGGLGITLTASDTVIFYSTTFSFADYDQAKARIDRIGQKSNSITYIHLIAKNTVDEDILEALRTKKDMADFIVDTIRKRLGEKSKKSSFTPFTKDHTSDIMQDGRTKLNKKKEEVQKMTKVTKKSKKATKVEVATTEEALEKKLKGLKEESEKQASKKVKEEPEVAKVKAKTKTKETKKAKVETQDTENLVELKELLAHSELDPKAARRILRSKLTRAEGQRWAWEKDSEELEEVKEILGLKAKPAKKKVTKKVKAKKVEVEEPEEEEEEEEEEEVEEKPVKKAKKVKKDKKAKK